MSRSFDFFNLTKSVTVTTHGRSSVLVLSSLTQAQQWIAGSSRLDKHRN
jgi:hypothetical protein